MTHQIARGTQMANIGPQQSGSTYDYELLSILPEPQYYTIIGVNKNFHPYTTTFNTLVISNDKISPIAQMSGNQHNGFSRQHTCEAIRILFYQSDTMPLFIDATDTNVAHSGLDELYLESYWTSRLTMYYEEYNASGVRFSRPFAKPSATLYDVPIVSGHPDAIDDPPILDIKFVSGLPQRPFIHPSGGADRLVMGYAVDYITQMQDNLKFMHDNPHQVPIHPIWLTRFGAHVFQDSSFSFLENNYSGMVGIAHDDFSVGLRGAIFPSGITIPGMTLADNIYLNNVQAAHSGFLDMGHLIDYVDGSVPFNGTLWDAQPIASGYGFVMPDAVQQISYPLDFAYNVYGKQNVKYAENIFAYGGGRVSEPVFNQFVTTLHNIPGRVHHGEFYVPHLAPIIGGRRLSVASIGEFRDRGRISIRSVIDEDIAPIRQHTTNTGFYTVLPLSTIYSPFPGPDVIQLVDSWYPFNVVEVNHWINSYDVIRAHFNVMTTYTTNMEIEIDMTDIPEYSVVGDVFDRFGKSYPGQLHYKYIPRVSVRTNTIGRNKFGTTGLGWTLGNKQHDYNLNHQFVGSGVENIYKLIFPSGQVPTPEPLRPYNYNNTFANARGIGFTGLFHRWEETNAAGREVWIHVGWDLDFVSGTIAGGSMVTIDNGNPIDLTIPSGAGHIKVNGRELTQLSFVSNRGHGPSTRTDGGILSTVINPPSVKSDSFNSFASGISVVARSSDHGGGLPQFQVDGIADRSIIPSSAKLDYGVIGVTMEIDITVDTYNDVVNGTCFRTVTPRCEFEMFNGLGEPMATWKVSGQSRDTEAGEVVTQNLTMSVNLGITSSFVFGRNYGPGSYLYYNWQDLYLIIKPGTKYFAQGGAGTGPDDPPANCPLPDDFPFSETQRETFALTINEIRMDLLVVEFDPTTLRSWPGFHIREEIVFIDISPGYSVPGSQVVEAADSSQISINSVPTVFDSYWNPNP